MVARRPISILYLPQRACWGNSLCHIIFATNVVFLHLHKIWGAELNEVQKESSSTEVRAEHWEKSCIVSLTVNSDLSSTWVASQPLSEKNLSWVLIGWCYSTEWLLPIEYRALAGETLKVLDAHTQSHSAFLISRHILTGWKYVDGRRILKGNLTSQCQNSRKVYKKCCPLFLGAIPRNRHDAFPSIKWEAVKCQRRFSSPSNISVSQSTASEHSLEEEENRKVWVSISKHVSQTLHGRDVTMRIYFILSQPSHIQTLAEEDGKEEEVDAQPLPCPQLFHFRPHWEDKI